jgi:hypothetical protein
MDRKILYLNRCATRANTMQSFLSFGKFRQFLETRVSVENKNQSHFYRFVLDKIDAFPALAQSIELEAVESYYDIFELIAAITFPLADEKAMVALTNASSPDAFYATNSFYDLFSPDTGRPAPQALMDEAALTQIHKQFQFSLILNKIYDYTLAETKELIYGFYNEATGLNQYFRIEMDTRFVEVSIKKGFQLICDKAVRYCLTCSNPVAQMESTLSLDHFTASGFAILTISDITEQQAVAQISKELNYIAHDSSENIFFRITRLLQTIAGSNLYRFGLMPFFTINNRAALPYENFKYGIITELCFKAGIPKNIFSGHMNNYLKKPEVLIYKSSNKHDILPLPVQDALKSNGFEYYVAQPIFFNNQLVGILEIATSNAVSDIGDWQLTKLEPAIIYIAQLLKLLTDKFNASIDGIIKDKFTNIQSSVQWKFREVAWRYFRNHEIEKKETLIEDIFFKDVYPLYGAVDIRNSTIERNRALQQDTSLQLEQLVTLLVAMHDDGFGGNYLKLADDCSNWLTNINNYTSVEDEWALNSFLHQYIHPSLAIQKVPEKIQEKIDHYFDSIDEQKGQFFLKRRQLESSIRLVNNTIGQHLAEFSIELHSKFPCYFEKFRTDGIEYDIYAGQSISPHVQFLPAHLHYLRAWQIESMAAIVKLIYHLQPKMDYPLQTTQLIYVNERSIDISFRSDERRFDVEGAYNIRYQIIKKRIDKVRIRDTNERLTQPGKIVIVYLNERELAAYLQKISELQNQKILLDDLEMLRLEDLQGVTGLNALRIGVNVGS